MYSVHQGRGRVEAQVKTQFHCRLGTVLPSKDPDFFRCINGKQGEYFKCYASVYHNHNVKHVSSTLVLRFRQTQKTEV